MTDENPQVRRRRKPRHRRSDMAGGVEMRAGLAGNPEVRRFGTQNGPIRTIRSQSSDSGIQISGSPVVYQQSYQVNDQWGQFTEVIQPGCVTSLLPGVDCRFLFNHDGLAMARTTSGTLRLSDSPTSLNFTADLDPRQTAAADLAIAIQRGDISQMSWGFIVAPGGDAWNDAYDYRVINQCSELLDISAVTYPASPTTEIYLEADLDDEIGGPDGTLGGSDPGVVGTQDGTGSRSRRIDVDLVLERLRRPLDVVVTRSRNR